VAKVSWNKSSCEVVCGIVVVSRLRRAEQR
jgi:hypothetical protein